MKLKRLILQFLLLSFPIAILLLALALDPSSTSFTIQFKLITLFASAYFILINEYICLHKDNSPAINLAYRLLSSLPFLVFLFYSPLDLINSFSTLVWLSFIISFHAILFNHAAILSRNKNLLHERITGGLTIVSLVIGLVTIVQPTATFFVLAGVILFVLLIYSVVVLFRVRKEG
jgi:hypothetical protein